MDLHPPLRLHWHLPVSGYFPLLPHRRMKLFTKLDNPMGRAHPFTTCTSTPKSSNVRVVDAPLLLELDPGGWIARCAGDQHHGHPALVQSVWEVRSFGVGLILLASFSCPSWLEVPTTTRSAWTTRAAHSSPDRILARFCRHGKPPRESALDGARFRSQDVAAFAHSQLTPNAVRKSSRSADPIDPSLLASNMHGPPPPRTVAARAIVGGGEDLEIARLGVHAAGIDTRSVVDGGHRQVVGCIGISAAKIPFALGVITIVNDDVTCPRHRIAKHTHTKSPVTVTSNTPS